jgi:tellurium resistance protein TerD
MKEGPEGREAKDERRARLGRNSQDEETEENEGGRVTCPSCGSTQITANRKGFGLGKAAVGGLLLGPVGLLGGLIGSKKVTITCLKCGHAWEAGKRT